MGRIVKYTLIALSAAILMLAGILFYYYTHPGAVARIVEKSASQLAGVSIERLSYSLTPFQIRMEGIAISPAGGSTGFSLKIPKLAADLELEGRFGRKTLVFKSIRIDGFSLRYDQAEFVPPGRPSAPESMVKTVFARLTTLFLFRDIRVLEIKLEDGNAVAALSGLSVEADGITAARNAERQIEFRADARILLSSGSGRLHIPNLHLLTSDTVSISERKVKAVVSATGASFQNEELSVGGIDAAVEGNLDIEKRRLDAPSFTFRIADAIEARGSLMAEGGRRKTFSVTVDQAHLLPRKLLAMAPARIAERLKPLQFSGELSAKGEVEASAEAKGWEYAYDLELRLMKNPISYTAGDHRLRGEVQGVVTARGNAAGAEIAADLKAQSAFYSDSRRSAGFSDLLVSLRGRHPEYRIENLSTRISQASGIPLEGTLPLKDFRFEARDGTVNVQNGWLRLPRVEMESSWLQRVSAGVEADADALRIRIERGSGLIRSAKKLDLLPEGWQLRGSDSFSIELVLTGGETLSIDSRIRLQDLAFEDPEAGYAGEGIDLEFLFNGRMAPGTPSFAGSASLRAAAGELLIDLFYFDLKKHPFSAVYEGGYDPAGRQLRIARLELGLQKALSLEVSGELGLDPAAGGHLSIRVPEVPIDPFFRLFVVEPFQRERAYLSDTAMEGRVSAELEAGSSGPAGRTGWSVKGHIRWVDGLLSVKEKGIRASGIHLDYPVWYRSDPGAEKGERITGGVSIGALKIDPVIDQPVRFQMVAEKNRISVPALPGIDLPWGSVSTGPIEFVDPYSEKRTLYTTLTVNPLDLTPLLSGIWPGQKKAVLQGSLDPVVLRGDRVETKGVLLLEAFGGSVTLSELGADRLSTDSPAVKLNARIDGVFLGPLTEETGFGRIEGALAGHVRSLEVAYGQPQRFDLLLETVERKGVPQKISIRAVENIARIGGGQSPFMGLAGAFTALFETLNYEKIGIRGSLENDLFKLNGTIVEGGKEYFIKGSLIAGVNIINQNPDNRIRFKDMVKRVQRVTSDTGSPRIE